MISWKQLPAKVILDVADLCDGHTIFKVSAFTDLGVPQELIDVYASEHESDMTDYKSTIFDNHGQIIPKMMGVYGLDVIESINREFGLPAPTKFGRGFRASQCRDQIKSYFGQISAS
jgi:hypothetical protein